MRRSVLSLCFSVLLTAACERAKPAPPPPIAPPVSGSFEVDGLSAAVRITRDRWGVPHIVASTRDDLFFAQGFVQAEDRLFQMDLWRRSAQGRLAEVLGSNFVSRDAMTRRIQYRGSLDEEWASYGPDARAIASAFVRGINAWVALARERPPEPFVLAGWSPEFWRPEDLLNRTDALLASGGAAAEVFRARVVAAAGVERAAALLGSDAPAGVPSGLDPATVTFQVGDALREIGARPFFTTLAGPAGSNAWAIAGRRSATGSAIVATDPHRLLSSPSLRYLVHLTAPGWNVIGATAPWMPGVAIGHNDRVAWGMTAFDADTADLYVERVNPENPHQVDVGGRWQNTRVVIESLLVKGRPKPTPFDIEYTPHGVVVGVDRVRHLAFTLRWSGAEPGGAGELGALALDRAASGAEVRAALAHWKMPAVDVIYAEQSGAIGSQVAGLVPIRRGWDGRLPVPGWSGRFEWSGWRSLDDLPHAVEPASGYLASANSSRARIERLRDVLGRPRSLSTADSARLQRDVRAWNADRLVPLFARLRSDRDDVEQVRERLLRWDREVSTDSIEAAVYVTWEGLAGRMLMESRIPGALADEFAARNAEMLVPALVDPSRVWFDGDVVKARDELVLRALAAAVDSFKGRSWRDMQKVIFSHPLAITEAVRGRFNIGPFDRAGYARTVMSMSGQRPDAVVGPSFSAVFDAADWDRSIAQNAPGQSESPDSAHFADLGKLWAAGEYFPLAFSEREVAAYARTTLLLVPIQRSTQRPQSTQSKK
jgi:penicillin amidase